MIVQSLWTFDTAELAPLLSSGPTTATINWSQAYRVRNIYLLFYKYNILVVGMLTIVINMLYILD